MAASRLTITPHAIERYCQRIGGNEDAAVAALGGAAVLAAVEFGARVVRLTHGRIVLGYTPLGAVVLTVLPIGDALPRTLRPQSYGGPPPIAQEWAAFPPPPENQPCPEKQP